jgi:D-glycero-alpha-D-manno-heptose 1-phosphate guanylyltransferase
MTEITGAILAGGLGTRLRSVVSDRPKVLALVRGKPFLAYLLDQLGEAGIRRVVLLTGYKGEQIEETFGSRYGDIQLEYSAETEPLGTAGALRLALPKLFAAPTSNGDQAAGTVLMLNGDSFCAADLNEFRAFHGQYHTNPKRERGSQITPSLALRVGVTSSSIESLGTGGASLVLTSVPDTSRFGKVEVAPDDRVERFVEKQEAGGAGWINAGIYLIPRNLIEQIPAGRPVSIEREMFPAWSQSGNLRGFRGQGEFLDIGTPESYRAAEEFFARRAA